MMAIAHSRNLDRMLYIVDSMYNQLKFPPFRPKDEIRAGVPGNIFTFINVTRNASFPLAPRMIEIVTRYGTTKVSVHNEEQSVLMHKIRHPTC